MESPFVKEISWWRKYPEVKKKCFIELLLYFLQHYFLAYFPFCRIVLVSSLKKSHICYCISISGQDILLQLEKEQVLVFTPARRIGGKRVVCYDDRFIIKLAAENGGIVVSNDNYRDIINEKPAYKKVIEERLLMYSFVNDR